MVQVDLPGAFAIGQVFALLSKKFLRKEKHKFTHRLMAPISWYFSLIYAPVGMFLLIGWPAWEGMYWWDWVEQPTTNPWVAGFYLAFFFSMVIIGHVSFVLAHKLYAQGKDRWVIILGSIAGVLTFLPFFLWPMTWNYVGTYAQYHAMPKETTGMFSTPSFFFSWLIIITYLVAGSILFGLWLKKYAAKLSTT